MFSGIVEDIGTIKSKHKNLSTITFEIESRLFEGSKIGDSIAVDGVCLTITKIQNNNLFFDVMPETINKTTLKYLSVGNFVNTERALKIGDRLGGHFVSGHVDCMGKIISQSNMENVRIIKIKPEDEFKGLVVKKGSIAIDGISLTIVDVESTYFSVSIIPHTLNTTTLKNKRIGDYVNLEFDYLAKIIKANMR